MVLWDNVKRLKILGIGIPSQGKKKITGAEKKIWRKNGCNSFKCKERHIFTNRRISVISNRVNLMTTPHPPHKKTSENQGLKNIKNMKI